jgi:hypothetical protein
LVGGGGPPPPPRRDAEIAPYRNYFFFADLAASLPAQLPPDWPSHTMP